MQDTETTGPTHDAEGRPIVDAVGMACPRPVLELAEAVRDAEVGTELRLLADDPAAKVDVPVWCRMQRQQLVGREERDGVLEFVVRKTRELR